MNHPKFTADVYEFEKVTTGAGGTSSPAAAKLKKTERPHCNSLTVTLDSGGSLRWTCDGTAPTASNGHELTGPSGFTLEGAGNCGRLQWFSAAGCVVQLSFGHN